MGVAARVHHRVEGEAGTLPATDRELGRPEAHHGVCGRGVYRERRDQAGARHDQARGRHQRGADGAAREPHELDRCRTPTSRRRQRQPRVVAGEIVQTMPNQDCVIALDRVLVNIDTSRIIPKNVDGATSA
jgi:hypothetical protein